MFHSVAETSQPTEGYPQYWMRNLRQRSIHVSIQLDNLRFASLRWLRKLKQAAGRHRDLDDLEHVPTS